RTSLRIAFFFSLLSSCAVSVSFTLPFHIILLTQIVNTAVLFFNIYIIQLASEIRADGLHIFQTQKLLLLLFRVCQPFRLGAAVQLVDTGNFLFIYAHVLFLLFDISCPLKLSGSRSVLL